MFINTLTYAQKMAIRGIIKDTNSKPIANASTVLLNKGDSTFIALVYSDDFGKFIFNNIKSDNYFLKITHLGYESLFQKIIKNEIDLGVLIMKEKANELKEVIVTANPILIKGDTLEFQANAFKVPEGATIEELLKKLPAINVALNGEITVMGQSVTNILIDGKPFFGNDIRIATKNLPANAFAKVQVYNYQSDLSKFTNSQNIEGKTINIELKESFRGKIFGQIISGLGGDVKRDILYQFKGNINQFRTKRQLSLIVNSNNTNNGGITWSDYQFNGENQNIFLGFGGNAALDGENENDFLLTLLADSQNKMGFQRNNLVGLNYNQDLKKSAFQNNFYFNRNVQLLKANAVQRSFIADKLILSKDSSSKNNSSISQRLAIHYENKINASNSLIISTNIFSNRKDLLANNHQTFYSDQKTISKSTLQNSTNVVGFKVLPYIIFRHKFKKDNRNIVGNFSYSADNQVNKSFQKSKGLFFDTNIQEKKIDQEVEYTSSKNKIKTSLLYTEPLGKNVFWDTFINFSQKNEISERKVKDLKFSPILNDTLSAYYDNRIIYKRFGSTLRFERDGIQANIGGAVQNLNMIGKVTKLSLYENQTNQTFKKFIPFISLNINLGKANFYGNYTMMVIPPPISALQPFIDNSNPFAVYEGNPNLTPTASHNISIGFSAFNPKTFSNFYINTNLVKYDNLLILSQNTDTKTGITRFMPINTNNSQNLITYGGFQYPFIPKKIILNINANSNFDIKPSSINDIFYASKSTGYSGKTNIQLNLPQLSMSFEGSWGANKVKYDKNIIPAQHIININYSGDITWNFHKNISINSVFDMKKYKIQNQVVIIPLWNSSIYGTLGKNKKTEIRLSVYDILKKNTGIIQSINQNTDFYSQTNTLSRYFLLSFVHRIKEKK